MSILKITKVELPFIPEIREGYILPINSEVNISQGYNGPYSHFATERGTKKIISDSRYAVDFKLPLGSEVLAAKNGRVFGVADFSDKFYQGLNLDVGLATSPNFIVLEHEDRTYTVYSHLEKEISLKNGEFVKKGEVIARTGMSGWVGPTPHLHFEAYEFLQSGRISFPVEFENYSGPLDHNELFF